MKKFLLTLLFFVLLVAAGVWFIFQPKTLGVKYTKENIAAGYDKLDVTFESLPASKDGKTLILSGSHKVDQTFSSEELTAMADNRHGEYAYFPFRKVQIRVNADGSVEGSATVAFADAVKYLLALGVSSKDIEEGAKQFKIPNATLPVYLKVSGNIANNKSNISVSAAEVARIPVPTDMVQKYTPAFNSFIESVIKARQPSYNIETLTVENGAVYFVGTAPNKEQAVKTL
jgi:hypothetical protein